MREEDTEQSAPADELPRPGPEPQAGTEPEPEPEPESERETRTSAPAQERQVLRRSRDDRVIAGVAGGLARYFGIDPILLRIAFVLLVFAGGAGIVAYVVLWVLVPDERPGEAAGPARAPPDRDRLRDGLGLALIAAGAFFLLQAVLPAVISWQYVWPGLLIVIGLLVLLRGGRL